MKKYNVTVNGTAYEITLEVVDAADVKTTAPAPAPAAPAKLFCGNCGTELAPGTKFCGNCGAAPNATPGTAPALLLNQNKKMLIIIAAAVVVVIGVIIGAVCMVSSGKDEAAALNGEQNNDEAQIRKVADAFMDKGMEKGEIIDYTFKHIKKVSNTYSYVCYEAEDDDFETVQYSVHVIKKGDKWKAVDSEDNWSAKDESRWK